MESRNKEINPEISDVEIENNINEAAAESEPAAFSLEGNQQTEKKSLIKRIKESGIFTKGFCVVISVFIIGLLIYLVSRFVPAFAEFWTRYPAQCLRFLLAKLTGWIPFSLAECIIISLPILAVSYITASTISTKRDESNENFYKWFRPLISALLVVITIFFTAFGPAYGRYTLAENLNINQSPVSVDELYKTADKVVDLAKNDLNEVTFDINGASVMPYDFYTLRDKVNEAFEKYAENEDYISHFSSNPKAIALSEPMTHTHISGVYTFMTGESNINTNYPDFLMPYTMTHEMAHQRGIAREDEANFVAFLVCINSDDGYLRYSGYTNMLNYLLSAISSEDLEMYKKFVIEVLPKDISKEFIAYSLFFDKYRDSVASDVTGAVNNTFLQSQGQQAGTKSYGLVVDLAVAYYKQ